MYSAGYHVIPPPALPAQLKRIRGGNPLVSYELLVTDDGRIAARHENVAGRETYFIYEYDESGHLLRAWRDGRLAEVYAYDPRGQLTSAGPWTFGYAGDGSLREAWTPQAAYFHPTVGRFTAPDPLGDTGGDHDLNDYCVDEPVGRVA